MIFFPKGSWLMSGSSIPLYTSAERFDRMPSVICWAICGSDKWNSRSFESTRSGNPVTSCMSMASHRKQDRSGERYRPVPSEAAEQQGSHRNDQEPNFQRNFLCRLMMDRVSPPFFVVPWPGLVGPAFGRVKIRALGLLAVGGAVSYYRDSRTAPRLTPDTGISGPAFGERRYHTAGPQSCEAHSMPLGQGAL